MLPVKTQDMPTGLSTGQFFAVDEEESMDGEESMDKEESMDGEETHAYVTLLKST